MNSACLLQNPKPKKGEKTRESSISGVFEFFLEREKLLSRIPANPTVGSLRDKKESCSTRKGLCVGTKFREFSQTPRCRGFSLLGFYSFFKYFVDV